MAAPSVAARSAARTAIAIAAVALALVSVISVTSVISAAAAASTSDAPTRDASTSDTSTPRTRARVLWVLDGDTITVRLSTGNVERVRLRGIDAPEEHDTAGSPQCFAREATAMLVALAPSRTELELEVDAADSHDRFGRTLAYVWLANRTMLNESLVRAGAAFAFPSARANRYDRRLEQAATDARLRKVGLWRQCTGESPATASSVIVSDPAELAAAAPCRPGQLKGNRRSSIVHAPGQMHYRETRADVACFDSLPSAIAAGFRPARR